MKGKQKTIQQGWIMKGHPLGVRHDESKVLYNNTHGTLQDDEKRVEGLHKSRSTIAISIHCNDRKIIFTLPSTQNYIPPSHSKAERILWRCDTVRISSPITISAKQKEKTLTSTSQIRPSSGRLRRQLLRHPKPHRRRRPRLLRHKRRRNLLLLYRRQLCRALKPLLSIPTEAIHACLLRLQRLKLLLRLVARHLRLQWLEGLLLVSRLLRLHGWRCVACLLWLEGRERCAGGVAEGVAGGLGLEGLRHVCLAEVALGDEAGGLGLEWLLEVLLLEAGGLGHHAVGLGIEAGRLRVELLLLSHLLLHHALLVDLGHALAWWRYLSGVLRSKGLLKHAV